MSYIKIIGFFTLTLLNVNLFSQYVADFEIQNETGQPIFYGFKHKRTAEGVKNLKLEMHQIPANKTLKGEKIYLGGLPEIYIASSQNPSHYKVYTLRDFVGAIPDNSKLTKLKDKNFSFSAKKDRGNVGIKLEPKKGILALRNLNKNDFTEEEIKNVASVSTASGDPYKILSGLYQVGNVNANSPRAQLLGTLEPNQDVKQTLEQYKTALGKIKYLLNSVDTAPLYAELKKIIDAAAQQLIAYKLINPRLNEKSKATDILGLATLSANKNDAKAKRINSINENKAKITENIGNMSRDQLAQKAITIIEKAYNDLR